jgi:hypothetical protein
MTIVALVGVSFWRSLSPMLADRQEKLAEAVTGMLNMTATNDRWVIQKR